MIFVIINNPYSFTSIGRGRGGYNTGGGGGGGINGELVSPTEGLLNALMLLYEFCVFVGGWRHAFRIEWPFNITILLNSSCALITY